MNHLLELSIAMAVNAAMQQNNVPLIREIRLENRSALPLGPLALTISCIPELITEQHLTIETVAPHSTWYSGPLQLMLNLPLLVEHTESVRASLDVSLIQGDQLLEKQSHPLQILAYDQWHGTAVMPELIAAFVTPNHPRIQELIRRASVILGEWTGSASMDEYQSKNPDRVRKQVAAIFQSIAELQVQYVSAPASFEAGGQRIRLADQVMGQRIGNCLDMSLLFCSCLEAVGIHPLLVIIQGHAFPGAWLSQDTFADPVLDDISLLSKRTADGIHDIILLEATLMNASHSVDFEQAVKRAAGYLAEPERFLIFIDIQRARLARIRPLPLRVPSGEGWTLMEEKPLLTQMDSPSDIVISAPIIQARQTSRQDLWERKLLDLSLRNTLLNMRLSKNMIQFMNTDLPQMEDLLSIGTDLHVLARPAEFTDTSVPHRIRPVLPATDAAYFLVQEELKLKKVRTYISEGELDASLTHLYRNSRQSLEENGANTLYLILGVLKWFETRQSEKPLYAPLLLLPVDLVRKAGHKGYVIRSREEDVVLNISLFEMLRKDHQVRIEGLTDIPRDMDGVDVQQILNHIRQAIMSQARWDVEDLIFLGQFSFSKFVMWNDIHSHADKLVANKIVKSLVDGQLAWAPAVPQKTDLDSIPVRNILLPIMADGSQVDAIHSAMSGESFILHGPPGTGKSQTITNIIANALYQGKRVLFVAEKMAALEVVEKRLREIGLENFYLELHSNKARKSALLGQFRKILEAQRNQSPSGFVTEAEKLQGLRMELHDYARALHQKRKTGLSIYEAINKYTNIESVPETISFDRDWLKNLSEVELDSIGELIRDMEVALSIIGPLRAHPLAEVSIQQYTPDLKEEVLGLLTEADQALLTLLNATDTVAKVLHLQSEPDSLVQFEWIKSLLKALQQSPDMPASFFMMEQQAEMLPAIRRAASDGEQAVTIKKTLEETFSGEWIQIDAIKLRYEWTEASGSWFLPRFLKQRKIRKSLRTYSAGKKIDNADLLSHLDNMIAYHRYAGLLRDAEFWLAPVLGFRWRKEATDWAQVSSLADSLIQILQAAQHLFGSVLQVAEWRTIFATELASGTKAWVDMHKEGIAVFLTAVTEVSQRESSLSLKLGLPLHANPRPNWALNRRGEWKQIREHLPKLKDWCHWQMIREQAGLKGLGQAVILMEREELHRNIGVVILRNLYRGLINSGISEEPVLSRFNGQLFDDKVKRFTDMIFRFQELTRRELYAVLSSRIPNMTLQASRNSEAGILQKAINNGGRGISIRQLFDQIPTVLDALCPCMLMSPISVAQYLNLESKPFDLVIFDEASQMPTSEAVGAMARGKELIVVGDPKQMPPTSFFSSQGFDEEFADKEDLESVLDDCLALSMPNKYLSWHYRSKHESLIAFSNSRFYENRLLTFPSVEEISSQVKWVRIEGFYDRGKTGVSRQEAEAIVKEVSRRSHDGNLKGYSIGIVTFNIKQQKLIQDLLDQAMAQDPVLEAALLERDEPLFVKNLENVQGDERDVILFSIGFGKDKDGRMYMNFGPLNREGGWRRLNVAVSRARYEMIVFSTMMPEDIDLSRTSADGAAGLRAFLEYASRGKNVLPGAAAKNGVTAKEALIDEVAAALLSKGFNVERQLGSSAFRIDIAVIHPQEKRYVLAIMCDGFGFVSAATVRDRHMGRVKVLEQLGWSVFQLWSADWWEDSVAVLQRLELRLMALLEGGGESAITDHLPEESAFALPLNQSASQPDLFAVVPQIPGERVYLRASVGIVSLKLAEEVYLPKHQALMEKQMRLILGAEAPMTRKLLFAHLAEVWRVTRLTGKMTEYFDVVLNNIKGNRTVQQGDDVLWLPGMKPDQLDYFRLPGKEFKREADNLPEHEVAVAAAALVKLNFGLQEADLVRELARVFGFVRMGKTVEQAMLQGIHCAERQKRITRQGDKYTIA